MRVPKKYYRQIYLISDGKTIVQGGFSSFRDAREFISRGDPRNKPIFHHNDQMWFYIPPKPKPVKWYYIAATERMREAFPEQVEEYQKLSQTQ